MLSVHFVSNWLWQNCPRIIQGLHKYVVHVLTTAYRSGKSLMSKETSEMPLEPSTPVLDEPDARSFTHAILPISHVWLLAATLPNCYIQVCVIKVSWSNYFYCLLFLNNKNIVIYILHF